MRIVLFCHTLLSDWNHGNAHFLRGIATELLARGHELSIYEPSESWSCQSLLADHGPAALEGFASAYPELSSTRYEADSLDLTEALSGAEVVVVHEWNDPALVRRIGEWRTAHPDCRLLFHDTHHRAATAPDQMGAYDLSAYDGVLAFGETIRRIYLRNGWARRVWVWHEAADTRVFRPVPEVDKEGDLVWIGNWGDDERTAELHEFLLEPVRRLGLRGRVYGVRYPEEARQALAAAGIEYGGWLPNYRAPEVFARYRVTVHVPRRPYATALPGIPTIRVFEALACGIPLVSAPWQDTEHLFTPGADYLVARNRQEMQQQLRRLLDDPEAARRLAARGRETVLARHTCAHRVDELEKICQELGVRNAGALSVKGEA